MFWGAKKIKIFFFKYCSVRTKKLHKMKIKKIIFDTWKKKFNLNWIYLHKIFVTMYSICYTRPQLFVLGQTLFGNSLDGGKGFRKRYM